MCYVRRRCRHTPRNAVDGAARGASDITAVSGSHVARDNAAVGVLVDGGLSGVLAIHYSKAVSL